MKPEHTSLNDALSPRFMKTYLDRMGGQQTSKPLNMTESDACEASTYSDEERRLLRVFASAIDFEDDVPDYQPNEARLERLVEIVRKNDEIDEIIQFNYLVESVLEEYVVEAAERRDCVVRMAAVAADPDALWDEYGKAEREYFDEFLAEAAEDFKNLLSHGEVLATISQSAKKGEKHNLLGVLMSMVNKVGLAIF